MTVACEKFRGNLDNNSPCSCADLYEHANNPVFSFSLSPKLSSFILFPVPFFLSTIYLTRFPSLSLQPCTVL